MAFKHDIQIKAQHISGNQTISRKQWEVFREAAPNADLHPQPILAQLQTLLSEATSIHVHC